MESFRGPALTTEFQMVAQMRTFLTKHMQLHLIHPFMVNLLMSIHHCLCHKQAWWQSEKINNVSSLVSVLTVSGSIFMVVLFLSWLF